jgi:hypothetical protein
MPGDTLNINSRGAQQNTFDAIVIGSGISGGWAAKEFCEHGLKTLVLERGRNVVHLKDYPTATKNPWDFPHRQQLTREVEKANPIVGRCYAFSEATYHFFVKDNDHPYIQEKPFDWIRGYQVGGNHCCGHGRPSGGANTTLKDPDAMDSDGIGRSAMTTSLPGIPTWKNLRASAAITITSTLCLTVNSCHHGK